MSEKIALLYTTVGSQIDAEKLAAEAVERYHAACANIIPGVVSVYRWKGQVEQSPEISILFKTHPAKIDALKNWLLINHPYELPAVLVGEVETSSEFYDYVQLESNPPVK